MLTAQLSAHRHDAALATRSSRMLSLLSMQGSSADAGANQADAGVARARARLDAQAAWFAVYDLPTLAFDHAGMVELVLKRRSAGVNG